MDLIDKLRELAIRIPKQLPHLSTEEATKTALVMPLISALGYNVFDPTEVVPEFTADVGTKKGEKVDYAILRDGQPIILFECKWSGCSLDGAHASQLYRYFTVTPARFGVLTNGLQYRFFSDLEEPNKMDSRPFLVLDLQNLDERTIDELKKFTKSSFDLESIISTASELKYTDGIKRVLYEEWVNPSEEFVRLFVGRVYSGRFTQAIKDQFTQIAKRALHEFINGRVNERLKSALETSEGSARGPDTTTESDDGADNEAEARSKIVTTEEEIEGYYVVKAILSASIDPRRVFMRDTRNYCGILLDDTNRKPICRLWFNGPEKYLGLFDENKAETRELISDVNDLYRYSDALRKTVENYDRARPKRMAASEGVDDELDAQA
ncbi:MAG: type I restriction enzyme HsdR N-terminal domain-containing protein [Phycisphaerae bacterium]|nr:type I restriction enzyme HsdR N-terminal domain-containing protein [Phycisphaerae bacterium]